MNKYFAEVVETSEYQNLGDKRKMPVLRFHIGEEVIDLVPYSVASPGLCRMLVESVVDLINGKLNLEKIEVQCGAGEYERELDAFEDNFIDTHQ